MISTKFSRDDHRTLDQLRVQQLLDQLDKLQSLHRSAEQMISDTVAELREVHERLLAAP
jgi:hypothetical protein